MDDNYIVGGLLIDLTKAFDCIPHNFLIARLDSYGSDRNTYYIQYIIYT